MREYILGRALASALDQKVHGETDKSPQECLQESPGYFKKPSNEDAWSKDDLKKEFMKDLSQDWENDPEKIAVPWEEKYLSSKEIKTKDLTLGGKVPVMGALFTNNNDERDDDNLDNFVVPWRKEKQKKKSHKNKGKAKSESKKKVITKKK